MGVKSPFFAAARSGCFASRWVAIAGLAAAVAPAQTNLFWNTNGAASTWTAANWATASAPPFSAGWSSGATAHFTSRSNVTFATATIGDVVVDPGVAVTVSAAGTLSTAGAVRTIDIGAGGSLTWINQTVSNNSPTGFFKTGAGTWSIGAQSNAYSGGFTLAQGTVVVTGARSLGTGVVTLAGGTLQSSGGIAFAASSLVLGGNVTFAGSGNDIWAMPTTVLAGQQVLTNATTGTATRTLAGTIAGSGTLVFSGTGGSGGIVLAGANSYSGGTILEAGLLRATGAASLGSGAAEIVGGKLALGDGLAFANRFTVDANGNLWGGTGTVITGSLGGAGTVLGAIQLGSGALLQPGSSGLGTLRVSGALTLDAGSTWVVDLSASSSDLLSLSSGASLTSNGATLRPWFADGFGPAGDDSFWRFSQLWTVASGDPSKTITGSWTIDNSAWASKGAFQAWPSGGNLVLGWTPAVPEPETYAYLACTATMGLALRRRRPFSADQRKGAAALGGKYSAQEFSASRDSPPPPTVG